MGPRKPDLVAHLGDGAFQLHEGGEVNGQAGPVAPLSLAASVLPAAALALATALTTLTLTAALAALATLALPAAVTAVM